MNKNKKIKSLFMTALLSSAIGLPAMAQEKPSGVIEEIIITAEKREASVQDTAIAITAFDSNLRDDLGIQGASDVANFTPGMTYNASPNRIFIRGVGRVDNSLGSEPGVAIYRDGVYTNEAAAVSDNTFFVDRIEVLRGPQGTLYGRNAIGGAANVISKKPSHDFEGALRLGAYSYGGQVMGLSLSGPITDRLRYRVAGERQVNDGWVKNIAPGGVDQNSLDFTRYSVQLEWDITDRLSWWVEYNNYEWDQTRSGAVPIDPRDTTKPAGHIGDFNIDFQSLVPASALGYTGPQPKVGEVDKDEAGYIKSPGNFVTSHLIYEADSWQFKYIYGFNTYDWEYLNDYDGTSRTDIQYLEYIAQLEEYSQHEIQAISQFGGDIEVILGAFYYRDDLRQPYTLMAPNNPVLKTPVWAEFFNWSSFDPVGPPPVVPICNCIVDAPPNPDAIFYDQTGALEAESYAGYAQVDYYRNDEWHISLGARYSKDEKTGYENQRIIMDGQGTYAFMANVWEEFFDDGGAINYLTVSPYPPISWFNVATEPYGVPTPGPQAHMAWDFYNGHGEATHTESWDSFTWSIGADWRPNDDTLLYAKVSTGYKAGGFRLGSLQPEQGVDEETLLAYEAGAKLTLGGTLQVNATTYLYDYQDMQVPVAAIINGVNNTFFQNMEQANQFGFEVDAQYLMSSNLTLFATYTYMDTEIERMGGNGAIDSASACSINPADVWTIYHPGLAAYDLPNRTGAAGGCEPEDWLGSQLTGNQLLLSPKNKVTLNAIYTWYLDGGEVGLAGSYVYQTEQFSDIFNTQELQIPGWQNVDLRLTYRRPDSGLRISAYIRNALDEEIFESITRTGWKLNNLRSGSLRPPRTVGIEVNLEF